MADDDIEKGCCHVSGDRCKCLPYNDAQYITAVILAFIAFFISWTWWVTFLLSFVGMIMFQTLWCCRCPGSGLYIFTSVAGFCSLISIGIGIYILTAWTDAGDCWVYTLETDVKLDGRDDCPEIMFASYAFACGVLWGVSAICMFCFVKGGRHARFEKKYGNTDATVIAVVELGTVSLEPEFESTRFDAIPIMAHPIIENDDVLITAVAVPEGKAK